MTGQEQRENVRGASLYAELKRRNVFRVGAAYVVIGWLSLQVADVVFGFTGAPEWVGKTLIALLLLGFFPALALAWVFEVGPNGVHVDDGKSDSSAHASRLDILTLIAVFFVVALMAWQHLGPAFRSGVSTEADTAPVSSSPARETSGKAATPRLDLEPLQAPPGSIAVLPFSNRSAEPDTAFFVDGVHDDLLTQLSRNGALTVISRTSVMEYRDTTKNLRQIGEELGVANVLEGAVQRAGKRVRINAQLIDARTDAHLWADTFDRELTPESIFEIQSEIATAIAAALGQTLAAAAGGEPDAVNLPTRSAKAYDFYLRGRVNREDWDEKSIRARMVLYRQALEADPGFALAMGELGREHLNLFWFLSRRDEDRLAGKQWIDRALALQPESPQLRLALAEFHYRAYLDYNNALKELAVAEQGLPGSADVAALRAFIMRRAGRPEETLQALQLAVKLDPRSGVALQSLAETQALLGDFDAADATTDKLEKLPNIPLGSGYLTTAMYRLQHTGDATRALAVMQRVRPLTEKEWNPVVAVQALYLSLLHRDFERMSADIEQMPIDVIEDQFWLNPKSWLRAQLDYARGRRDAAVEQAALTLQKADELLQGHPEDYRVWMLRALALAMLERDEEAREAVRNAMATEIATRDVVLRSELQIEAMQVLAMLGDGDGLAQAMDAYLSLPMRYWGYDGVMLLPVMERFRDQPAMQALARKHARKGS